MYITNVTLTDDYEDLYDDIWEAMDCDNGTTINMEVKLIIEKFFPVVSLLFFFSNRNGKCFWTEKTNVEMILMIGSILPLTLWFPSFKQYVQNIRLAEILMYNKD